MFFAIFDQMNIRLRKLEKVITNLSPPVTEVKDLYVERDKVDLEDAKVPAEFISGNPLLSTLYDSESHVTHEIRYWHVAVRRNRQQCCGCSRRIAQTLTGCQ